MMPAKVPYAGTHLCTGLSATQFMLIMMWHAHAKRMSMPQSSRGHPDGPDHFILQDVQSPQETEVRRFNFCLKGGLGHFQAHQIVGNQGPPDFLLDPCGLLTTQSERRAEHGLLEFAIARFDLPATAIALGQFLGLEAAPPSSTV